MTTDISVKFFHNTLNGKKIAYSSETVFCIQIGKGSKESYFDKYRIKGDLRMALEHYNSVNVDNGFKKRLYCGAMNKPVLARFVSPAAR